MALKIQPNQIQLLHYLTEQQSNRQFSRLLEISFTLVVITLFIIFAVRPSVTTIASLFGEVKAKQEFSSLMKGQINKVVEAQDIYAQIQARSVSINKALGSTPGYVYTKNQLLWLAGNSQIFVDGIDYPSRSAKSTASPDPSFLKSSASAFKFTANYESIVGFLSQLHQLKKVGQVTQFSVGVPTTSTRSQTQSPADPISTPDKLEASFTVNFNYWSPNEKK